MHFVGGKSGDCADGVVVSTLDVWELNILVSLLFVANHGEHEGHDEVDALDSAVGARVVGAGDHLIGAEAIVESEEQVWSKAESVIGKNSDRASPEKGASVNKDIGRAGGGELSLCSGVHVGATAETICKKEDEGIAPRR